MLPRAPPTKKKPCIKTSQQAAARKGKWGDARTYDLTVNSSRLGLDGTADALEAYIRARIVSEEKKEDVLQNRSTSS